jgi:hypothetical protein
LRKIRAQDVWQDNLALRIQRRRHHGVLIINDVEGYPPPLISRKRLMDRMRSLIAIAMDATSSRNGAVQQRRSGRRRAFVLGGLFW